MSNERAFGADMIPEPIPDFAIVEVVRRTPVTPAEQSEDVNADVLRRALHVRMDALVRHIRGLPHGSPINVPNEVRGAYLDIESAIQRYLHVERTFRQPR